MSFRYPGANATKQDAAQAVRDAKVVRKEARLSLGFPGGFDSAQARRE